LEKIKSHDLFDFMSQITEEIASEYKRIQKRATEDSGTAGDQGEENWATLLRDWLPPTYQVVTKGRIINHDGKTSPQVDVIVLKSSYPKKLLDKKLYLAAGVAAVFECKITLKSSHITKALETCIEIKSFFTPKQGSPFKDLNTPIIYGLLAHSHSWKGERSSPVENITNQLFEEDIRLVKHPREMIDFVCVADLGSWIASKRSRLFINQILNPKVIFNQAAYSLTAFCGYVGHTNKFENQVDDFSPVGALIFSLFYRLAWENEEYRSLANYYEMTNISGAGSGLVKEWKTEIYSEETKLKLEKYIMGIEKPILSDCDAWDEWKMDIIQNSHH
jgi:hypothetical protein